MLLLHFEVLQCRRGMGRSIMSAEKQERSKRVCCDYSGHNMFVQFLESSTQWPLCVNRLLERSKVISVGCRMHEGTPSIIFSFLSFPFLYGSSAPIFRRHLSFWYVNFLPLFISPLIFQLIPTVHFLFPFDHLTHTHTFSFSALKECKAFPLPPLSLFFPSLAQFPSHFMPLNSFSSPLFSVLVS